jgi:hypothetical protein
MFHGVWIIDLKIIIVYINQETIKKIKDQGNKPNVVFASGVWVYLGGALNVAPLRLFPSWTANNLCKRFSEF